MTKAGGIDSAEPRFQPVLEWDRIYNLLFNFFTKKDAF
jgi:hypothetical protein